MKPIRIGNCSGFFGDRLSAAAEMVRGGQIDVLTGDWLAELTMVILAKQRMKHPESGYARTFLHQMEEVLGECVERGIKVVSNAGGLNPEGCAQALNAIAKTNGISAKIAWISGDDLTGRAVELIGSGALVPFDDRVDLGDGSALLTAHAYLGCWGIVEALRKGADVVITGRTTDAALVCGPAAWHHGWERSDFDALAGAVVAGHVIECGTQATGGNYSFIEELPREPVRMGFPWVEIAGDGSSVVGKHDGTGGLVSVGTVTSQLLYEIAGPRYLGPDVTARFDTIQLVQLGADRVGISGVRGESPPARLKVACNVIGGYRNTLTVALTGLDIERKAELVHRTFWDACPYDPEDFASVTEQVDRTEHEDPDTQAAATATWRLVLKDPDQHKVGRAVSDAMVQTALGSIAGMYSAGGAPAGASVYAVYIPGLVDRSEVQQQVLGETAPIMVDDTPVESRSFELTSPAPTGAEDDDDTVMIPLGRVMGARSGDKGGDANLGCFVRSDAAYEWLDAYLTVDQLRGLLPEVAPLDVERYAFPNLRALNFLVRGLLGEGVASSTRIDAQAKALGEWIRARMAQVPTKIVD